MAPRNWSTSEIDLDLRRDDQERDLELVRRIRLGDVSAKEELYVAYADYLTNFLLDQFQSQFWTLVPGTPSAEGGDDISIPFHRLPTDIQDALADVVADTFMRAFDRLERYDPDQSTFVTWLFTIGRNLMHNKLRDEARSRAGAVVVELEPEHPLHLPPSAGDPEHILTRREEYQDAEATVREVLGSLTPKQGEALWLRYGFGLKVREVALQMGLSEDAAESLIRRARGAVRTSKRWGSGPGLDS
jgi:RNA polymerase sigma factor (sigma-70 family)